MELPLIGNLFLWGLQPFRLTRLVRKTAEPFKKKKKRKRTRKRHFHIDAIKQADARQIAEDNVEIPPQFTLGLLFNERVALAEEWKYMICVGLGVDAERIKVFIVRPAFM